MPRPYVFPDPNDRSPNKPQELVEADQILGLYNQSTGESMKRVVAKVQDWFVAEAKRYQWDSASFVASSCVLSNDSVIGCKKSIPED